MSKLTHSATILALTVLTFVLTTQVSEAATFTVSNINDSGLGSLRQAIADADATPGADTILFDTAGVFATPQIITLTSGELAVGGDLTITGTGAANLTISGNNASRVFHIGPGNTVTIDGLTIANGNATFVGGGGIYNDHASLTVMNSIVSNSYGPVLGGGIYSNGNASGTASLTIINSTISGNLSGNAGGGIFNNGAFGSAAVTITDSVISGNSSSNLGGGFFNNGNGGGATLTIVNCTFSSNSTLNAGGGIFNETVNGGTGIVSVKNSTFNGNVSNDVGGSIYNEVIAGTGTVSLGNTILNAGPAGGSILTDGGSVTSLGHNLSSDGGNGLLTGPGDIINTDPLLGPLQDNGGPTKTHALLAGSPAINAGDNSLIPAGVTTDQRSDGFVRIVRSTVDIGSYEVQVCPQPQGYWKNNPSAWPVTSLTLGSQSYSQSELLAILNTPAGTGKNADASLILAYQLIAAKLNAANGANASSVSGTVASADALLSTYTGKLPYRVRPTTASGQLMVAYGTLLDAFNKGTTTAGCTP